MRELKIFSGNANRVLAEDICGFLHLPLGAISLTTFPDGEKHCKINEDVRGRDIFIIQPTAPPVNDNLMELLIMIDAAKRASAGRITAVIPYYAYGRSDKKDQPRVPVTARLVANFLEVAGADRVLTLDLHAGQIQGFFDIPVDNLFAAPVMIADIQATYQGDDLVVVSPDVGGVVRARAVAKRIDADLAIVDKRRERAGVSEVMNIIGDVDGRVCVMVDDIVDSAGTLCNAAAALKAAGASEVHAYVTHAVLSGGAVARVSSSELESLVVTDTIAMTEAMRISENIKTLSIAKLMAEAIRRISAESSVSSLFN